MENKNKTNENRESYEGFDRRAGNLQQAFGEAEQALRSGLATLGEWSEQARQTYKNRPGVVLASLSIAGFMSGLMLREGRQLGPHRRKYDLPADPFIVFVTGVVAGLTLGPRILKEVLASSTEQGRPEDTQHH
jgi:hypothetical protein